MPSAEDRGLSEVRDDLIDGEDLSLAARLIGDTLARRIRRARQLLDELQAREGAADAARLDQLRRRADEVESQLRQLSSRFAAVADAFEHDLTTLADDLGA